MAGIVVVGGVAAGMSAASQAKRREPDAEVVVLERGPHVSYQVGQLDLAYAPPLAPVYDPVLVAAAVEKELARSGEPGTRGGR